MDKFEAIYNSVFSVFAKPEWDAEGVKAYPSNFNGKRGPEYIEVSVLPGGPGVNLNSASGSLIVDIYTPAGEGPIRAAVIAGKLNKYFVGTSLMTGNNRLQFGASGLGRGKLDTADPTLYRSTYSLPFNYFEAMS